MSTPMQQINTPLQSRQPRRTSKPTPPQREQGEVKKICQSVLDHGDNVPVLVSESVQKGVSESDISSVFVTSGDSTPHPTATQGSIDGQPNISISLSHADMEVISNAVCNYIVQNMMTIMDPILTSHFTHYNEALIDANNTITRLKEENEDLRRQVDALDQYNRRNSLHVTGIKEEVDETTEKILVRELSKVGLEISPSDIDDSYRIGSAQGGRTRPIIVKFSSYRAKRRILVARRNLPKGVYVNDDLTSERSSIAYKARQLVKQRILNKTWISNGKIMVIDRLNRKHAIDTHANLELLASPSYITKNTTTHLHVPQSPGISYAGIVSGKTSVQIPSLEGAVAASVTTGTVTTPATV
ncbi:hypothetical protein FSP39_014747 [Pinctada imbricata]|uniref:Uncharacterized protein n=1 Tax=Pinctada imbricata TaxID=66713 RepID=A0AA88YDL9_PINIB|nr:hypothetical protein FSP39_014747 [Pinctada imbricata]